MSTVITNNPRILLIGLSPPLSLFIFETLISLTSLNFSTSHPTPWAQILNCNMEIFSFQEVIAVLFPCIKTKTKVNGFVKINASFLSFQGEKRSYRKAMFLTLQLCHECRLPRCQFQLRTLTFLISGHFQKKWSPVLNYSLFACKLYIRRNTC